MDLNAFRDGVLREHNIGRQKYGNVAPLCLDANINKEAQTYAERLALIDMPLRHSKRTHLGKRNNSKLLTKIKEFFAEISHTKIKVRIFFIGTIQMELCAMLA